jgi:hypothetical protein
MATASLEPKHAPAPLPKGMRRALARVARKIRGVGITRGLGIVGLVLAAVAGFAMAADVAWVLPLEVRWALWGFWLLAAAATFVRGVLVPLFRRLGWNELAAVAEAGDSSLSERLTSAVGLLRERPHGSRELMGALFEDANARAKTSRLTGAISSRKAFATFFAGLAATAFVVAPAFVKPHPYQDLWKRFLAPWKQVDRVGRLAIDVSPGDVVIAIGSDVDIAANVRARFAGSVPSDTAWLEWTNNGGSSNRIAMEPDSSSSADRPGFKITLPKQAQSLKYRVVFGRDQSRQHAITAVPAPAIAELKIRIEPPAYTKRPVALAADSRRIEAWEDSRITFELEGNRPLAFAAIAWPIEVDETSNERTGLKTKTLELNHSANGNTWTTALSASASGPFHFDLQDQYGLKSPVESPRVVAVIPDRPPSLAVAVPGELKETHPNDLLAVPVVAHDDVAVASVELHYAIERSKGWSGSGGPTSGHVSAVFPGLGTASARGEAAINLKTLGLAAGDVVTYKVRVADNRPAPRGPNVVWSNTHSLSIVAHSESLLARQGAAEREELRARLEAIRKQTAANRDAIEKNRSAAESVMRGGATWDDAKSTSLAAAIKDVRGVGDQLQLIAGDFEMHPTFGPLARPARQLADVENDAVAVSLEAAAGDKDASVRHNDARQAGSRLGIVWNKLDELIRKFEELARRDDDRRRLRLMAERQNELAAQLDEAAKSADSRALDPIQAEQEKLRRELEELLKNSPALRAEAISARAHAADDLAARARALAEQQRDAARKTADDTPRRAAIKALAARQRALEDDARRLALKIDEPLTQNWRSPVNVGSLARAVETIEQGDLDQSRERAREAEYALNQLALDLEDIRTDPKAAARRLAQRQEALRSDAVQALREARENPPQTPEGKMALAARIKPLTERQDAIAKIAAKLPVPPDQQEHAKKAAETTARAHDDLRDGKPRDLDQHQSEARDALNRLAEALPDPNQKRGQAAQKLNEARGRFEEINREIDRQLQETAPKGGQRYDPGRAAADLARAMVPLARRQREVATALAAIEPDHRAIPQRDRAARRALALADALENLQEQLPPPASAEKKLDEPRPQGSWRVIGAFPSDQPDPFPPDQPVNLNASFPDRKKKPAEWKPAVASDDSGTIDLGAIYTRDDKVVAYGYSELVSPTARVARMLVGSDDSLTVWLNGKQVYTFAGNRAHGPGTDRLDVTLAAGINRLVVKCGNINGEWKFSVAVSPPSERFEPIRDWQVAGTFNAADKPPFAVDAPINLTARHAGRKGSTATWQPATPVNEQGAIDLAAIFKTRDDGVAAYGFAEIKSNLQIQTRMRIGSNDTLTVWLNGKQVYDSQVGRGWAPDHALVEVPLESGINRLLVKCGNKGGKWMYSIALAEDWMTRKPTEPLASAKPENPLEPTAERIRESLPTLQAAARASMDRLQRKFEGNRPADDLAADLAADQHQLQAEFSRADKGDAEPRKQAAEAERRLASALRNLDAPDTPLARAEAIERAEAAAQALEKSAKDPAAAQAATASLERAAAAADQLAEILSDQSPASKTTAALAQAQHALAQQEAAADPIEQARRQQAILVELSRLSARQKGEATQAVARAASLASEAAQPAAIDPPTPTAVAGARDEAAVALDRLAKSTANDAIGNAPPAAPANAHVPAPIADVELGLDEAQVKAAAELARRQRHIREELQAVLGNRIAEERSLHAAAAKLAREMTALRDQTQEISPRAHGPASAAADLLGRAIPETMDRAIDSLGQARPQEALNAQRQAADFAEQAARQAEDAAAGLRADTPSQPANGNPGELADALSAQAEAARQLAQARNSNDQRSATAGAAQAAATAMHQAADELRAASQPPASANRSPAATASAVSSAGPTSATSNQTGTAELKEIQSIIRAKTGRSWGELPNHLRTEILQISQGRYRQEYVRLIELYFRQIAADAPSRGGKK